MFVLFAAILNSATVAVSEAPVAVTCSVLSVRGSRLESEGVRLTDGVSITGTNRGTKTIRTVTVNAEYNGYRVTDTWHGTLGPNARVTFEKHYQQQPYSNATASCRVSQVTFADGTAWSAGPDVR